MSFLELLRKRIIYYRFQAMVFGLLSFVFSIIILGCVITYDISDYAKKNVGKDVYGTVKINSCEDDDEVQSTARGQKIKYDWMKQMVKDERVADYDVVSMSGVHGKNVTHMLLNDENLDKEDKDGNLALIYQRNMLNHMLFKELGNTIIEGRSIEKDEKGNGAVVSQTFAEQNNIAVGNEIYLESVFHDEIVLEVVGISSCKYQSNIAIPIRMSEYNQIFTTKEMVDRANQSNNVLSVEFQMKDCKEANEFLQDLKKTINETKYIFHVYTTEYNMALSSIINNQTTSNILMFITIVLGCVIISLFAVYSLAEHLKDIGILYSLGKSKKNIIMQYVMELTVPVFAGNLICLLIYICVKDILTELLCEKVSFGLNIVIHLEKMDILLYFSCVIIMILFSIGYICFKVVKNKPKELLM